MIIVRPLNHDKPPNPFFVDLHDPVSICEVEVVYFEETRDVSCCWLPQSRTSPAKKYWGISQRILSEKCFKSRFKIVGFWQAIHHIARSLARVHFMQKLFALVWAPRHFFKITIETHAAMRKDSSAISDIAYEYFANAFAVRVNGSFKDSWSLTFSQSVPCFCLWPVPWPALSMSRRVKRCA